MVQINYIIIILLIISYICCCIAVESTEIDSIEIDDHDELLSNAIDEHNFEVTENRLAAQLIGILEHYKQDDPMGFPGAPIEDPIDVPDMKKSLGMANLNMMNVKTYGLSKFRIKHINADIKAMKVEAGIQLDEMIVKGQYTLTSFFSKASGPFEVILKDVFVKCLAALAVEPDGHLTTERIKMDITFASMSTDFKNLGFLGSVFQSIVNSAPNLVFDAMKPFMMQETDRKLRADINKNIEKLMKDRRLPNSVPPLDIAIAAGRKKVRAMGYDPYRLPDYNRTVGIFSMQLTNTWISGLSSFYRIGDMIAAMSNNTVSLRFQIGTQQITGAGQWEASCSFMTRAGVVQFSLQHILVDVAVSQPLDTRKRPQINDLQIELGNIQVRFDGAGTLDYVVELAVNVLPNLLRYQIINALENPIKMRIQEKFNTIDVERAIKENFDKFQISDKSFDLDFKI